MPKLLIFDAFTLLIPKKTVANYALLRCKTFSLKIWVCKIFDKFHVCSHLANLTEMNFCISCKNSKQIICAQWCVLRAVQTYAHHMDVTAAHCTKVLNIRFWRNAPTLVGILVVS